MVPTFKDGDWLLVSWFPSGLTPLIAVADSLIAKIDEIAEIFWATKKA